MVEPRVREPKGRTVFARDLLGNVVSATYGEARFQRGISDVEYVTELSHDGVPINDITGLAIRTFDSRMFAISARHQPWEPSAPDESGVVYEFDFGQYPATTGMSEPRSYIGVLTRSIRKPVGIALSADGRRIYVADAASDQLWAIDVARSRQEEPRIVTTPKDALQGLHDVITDGDGNVLCATAKGVAFFRGTTYLYGPPMLIETPEPVHALTFGDEDGRTLYIAAGRSVYSIRMRTGVSLRLLR